MPRSVKQNQAVFPIEMQPAHLFCKYNYMKLLNISTLVAHGRPLDTGDPHGRPLDTGDRTRETGTRETGTRETGTRETGTRETGTRETDTGDPWTRLAGPA